MRSNSYTLFFTSTVTVILGFLLSIVTTSLKDAQELNIAVDKKKNILRSLNVINEDQKKLGVDTVQSLFDQYIKGIVVDGEGKILPDITPSDLTEKDSEKYPVYMKKVEDRIEGYAIPISGKGLWSTIYGYIALKPDMNTVQGITFYKHGETPGLGGEIEKKWFTDNYKNKTIFDKKDQLVGIVVIKGKVDPTTAKSEHQVDGISGATMTAKGLNLFLLDNLKSYEPYFRQIRKDGA